MRRQNLLYYKNAKLLKNALSFFVQSVLQTSDTVRQLPNGSHDFFQTFSIYFFNYFIKNPQNTIALPFLTHNISAIGGVWRSPMFFWICWMLSDCFSQYFVLTLLSNSKRSCGLLTKSELYVPNIMFVLRIRDKIVSNTQKVT